MSDAQIRILYPEQPHRCDFSKEFAPLNRPDYVYTPYVQNKDLSDRYIEVLLDSAQKAYIQVSIHHRTNKKYISVERYFIPEIDYRVLNLEKQIPTFEIEKVHWQASIYQMLLIFRKESELFKKIHHAKKIFYYKAGKWHRDVKRLIDFKDSIVPIIARFKCIDTNQKEGFIEAISFIVTGTPKTFYEGEFNHSIDTHYLTYTLINYIAAQKKISTFPGFYTPYKYTPKREFAPAIPAPDIENKIRKCIASSKQDTLQEQADKIRSLEVNLATAPEAKKPKIQEALESARQQLEALKANQIAEQEIVFQETLSLMDNFNIELLDVKDSYNKISSIRFRYKVPMRAKVNVELNGEQAPEFWVGPLEAEATYNNLIVKAATPETFHVPIIHSEIIHPHGGQPSRKESGNMCCLGELKAYLAKAFTNNSLSEILYYIHVYLSSANANHDEWGTYFVFFPQAIDETHKTGK